MRKLKSDVQKFINSFENKYNIDLDSKLLVEALTHKSFSVENSQFLSYERLEFLGDSVIELVVSEYIYRSYSLEEGQMTMIRANTVSKAALASYAQKLDLGKMALVGKNPEEHIFRQSTKLLGDLFEALVGCIFLVNGYNKTTDFILKLFKAVIDYHVENSEKLLDPKGKLATIARHLGLGEVVYEYTSEGEDHNTLWTSKALIDGHIRGVGQSTSQKDASKKAAEKALETFDI
ncbi:MAG: ribonuclease III [Bifidobacteriaceae bacterium]|jgi:ribonuclease-3|nr:ribonuclease III [Bifidobacteriaceae bacterium]